MIPGSLARKTYLYEQPKQEMRKWRKSGDWVPRPSPYRTFVGSNGVIHEPPQETVLQFV